LIVREPGAVSLGPTSLVVLGVPSTGLGGAVRPWFRALVEGGIVEIVDAAVIVKDSTAAVSVDELAPALGDADALTGDTFSSEIGLLSERDLESIAADLAPGWIAVVLILEQTWMRRVHAAARTAGGTVLAATPIPPEVLDEVLAPTDEGEGDGTEAAGRARHRDLVGAMIRHSAATGMVSGAAGSESVRGRGQS
jgi:hypothetical protein